MKKIQNKIDSDELIQSKKVHEKISDQKTEQDDNIGQLTLGMIANLRGKYFKELSSVITNERYQRIQSLKDNYIP